MRYEYNKEKCEADKVKRKQEDEQKKIDNVIDILRAFNKVDNDEISENDKLLAKIIVRSLEYSDDKERVINFFLD